MGLDINRLPSTNRSDVKRKADQVGFRIGLQGQCYRSTAEAIRIRLDLLFKELEPYGVELGVLIMETEPAPQAGFPGDNRPTELPPLCEGCGARHVPAPVDPHD